jgi:phenylpropionate dioxygenase-like ring-hydroxylating dioxygenase large terminal subunit
MHIRVWMDTPATADYNNLPSTRVNLDSEKSKKDWFRYNFQIDLPYDHSFLVENLLDPAHIPVSHDGTDGGGKKENAQPLIMNLIGNLHSKGFQASSQNSRTFVKKDRKKALKKFLPFMKSGNSEKHVDVAPPVTEIDFEAPGVFTSI